jgi:methyl-accepting chemotaxis protein
MGESVNEKSVAIEASSVETETSATSGAAVVTSKKSLFSVFGNLKIGHKITANAVFSIVGLLAFALVLILGLRATSNSAANIEALAKLAPSISATVHEMQKERGMSAGFIASKGVNFADRLPGQRTLTDQKRAALLDAIQEFDVAGYGSVFSQKVSAAQSALSQMDNSRTGVASLTFTVPQMAAYYTSTIASLLTIVEEMALLSDNAELTNAITAYTSLLQGKERAGIERAMGAGGFGGGKFAPATHERFVKLIAMQETFHRTFVNYGSAEQKRAYDSTVRGRAVDEVERMRRIAIDSVHTGTLAEVTGPYWFDQITAKINLLKEVEDVVAHDLVELADGIVTDASGSFFMSSAIAAALIVVISAFSFFLVRSITSGISGITNVMTRLSAGDLAVEVTGGERGDEIGEMSRAVETFKLNAIENKRLEEASRKAEEHRLERERQAEEEKVQQEERAREERRTATLGMADKFESSVASLLQSVTGAVGQLSGTASQLTTSAAETSELSLSAASSSEQAGANVQTVAAAAEEMSSAVAEIARRVDQASQLSQSAVERTADARARIDSLTEGAEKIGDIVDMINDIAGQTNLLALNATIEAARAGDAGKGFAVVASEVKSLADQTAGATEEITGQVSAIQEAVRMAVDAVAAIAESIEQVNAIATEIAASVEEQNAATGEISRNAAEAATGTSDANSNVSKVSTRAKETGEAASEVQTASSMLASQSEELQQAVDGFLGEIRSA